MNRRAFTLVELMIATFLTCVIAAGVFVFFSGSGRLSKEAYETVSAAMSNRVEHENAQYMEADAIVWDAIALNFNTNYAALKAEYWESDHWRIRRFDTTNLQFAATLSVTFDGSGVSAWLEWNGQVLSNRVTRSEYDRWKEEDQ